MASIAQEREHRQAGNLPSSAVSIGFTPSESSSVETLIALLEPLADHLRNPEVSEVMVNGDGGVYVETSGRMHRESVKLSRYLLEEAAINIARQYGDDIGPNRPLLAARLQDGSRVAIIYPPCSVGGPTIAIRKFQQRLFSMDELMRIESVTPEQARVLMDSIALRENVLISGSTSTGKTTLVNARRI
jgi:pilus assembly protein CpaF